MRSNLFTWVCLTSLSLSYNGYSQENEFEVITVSAKRDTVIRHANPLSVTDIERTTLDLVAPQHIQHVLNLTPGVNFARGSGQEYLPAIRSPVLTGAGGCGSILTSIDGIPARASGFCNINELFDTPYELAEQLEVIRGSGSVLYGSNAMNGVINVVTPNIDASPWLTTKLELASFGLQRVFVTNNLVANTPVRIDAMLAKEDGFRDDSGYNQQKLAVKHAAEFDQWQVTNSLQFNSLNQQTAGYIVGDDAYKSLELSKQNENPEAFRNAMSLRAASQFELTDGTGKQHIVTPYFRHTEMSFLMHYLPGQPLERNGHSSVGLQSLLVNPIDEHWELSYGVDLEYSQGYLRQSQDNPTSGSAFLQQTIPQGKQYDYRVDAAVLSLFGNLSWQLFSDAVLTLGGRAEAVYYNYNNLMLAGRVKEDGSTCGFGGCRYSRPEDTQNSFVNVSPKLGYLQQLTPNSQLFVNLSEGFRAPQATELYRLEREQTVADLRSESILSKEIGYRFQTQDARFELMAYQYDKTNIIYRDTDFFNVSGGKMQSHGLELALAGDLGSNWFGGITMNYGDHRYRHQFANTSVSLFNNVVDSAPRSFGHTAIGYLFEDIGSAQLHWQFMGRYFTDPENLHQYDGHQLLNFYSQMQLGHWRWNFKILNLTDVRYAKRADYSSFSGPRYFPGESRSVSVSMERTW